MTREQIYWALALNLAAGLILLFFLQPLFEWARGKLFDWLVSFNSRLEAALYRKLARRRLSLTNITVFGFFTALTFLIVILVFVSPVTFLDAPRVPTSLLAGALYMTPVGLVIFW